MNNPAPTRHQRQTHPARPAALSLAIAIAATILLSGCNSAGSMTCDQYAAQSFNDRQNTERALLSAHDLDQNSIGNTVGLLNALNSYCGVSGLGSEKARQNGSSTLDKAVNWSAKNW
ncbi:hypothetical protein [Arthrobacter bambusae]|uniref:Uncharacterized protein n=1 Tax=Arthrobacter bambusae TaxID=1338426 RepID=A0AAW8D9L6_9MICC|nr:hypothetical protein [Arthrobacter bambusae]MDP9905606.1 hypothetical protein [Arthrobacter bambusae]MDQ0127312.1 hypothetical protein [Arthrobacter bambusae]MDQ0178654.1 hypothetical protein [Arthrobacter bambusae]